MRSLSNELLAQLYGESSDDPFLMLITLDHESFDTVRLVNNTQDVVSNGNNFTAFPMRVSLPADDGETSREVDIEFDNVSLDLIDEIRVATTPISCKIEMILSTNPDDVQISLNEMKIANVTYSKQNIRAKLYLDDFLNTEMTSEKYTPQNFPGIF